MAAIGASSARPLLREGEAIGVLLSAAIRASTVHATREIELLETFADQAVIAIENARLFEELEQRNAGAERGAGAADGDRRDPARHRQLARPTSTGARRRRRERRCALCDAPAYRSTASKATTWSAIGCRLGAVAERGHDVPADGPHVAERPRDAGRADDPSSRISRRSRRPSTRSPEPSASSGAAHGLATPLLREGVAIGVITVGGSRSGRSPTQQIALLETFADQAVIAIENARLFEELEQRNAELSSGAGAADGDGRGAAGHRLVADRPPAGPRRPSSAARPSSAGADGGTSTSYDETGDTRGRASARVSADATSAGPSTPAAGNGGHGDAVDGQRPRHARGRADPCPDLAEAVASRVPRIARRLTRATDSALVLACRCSARSEPIGVLTRSALDARAVHRASRSTCWRRSRTRPSSPSRTPGSSRSSRRPAASLPRRQPAQVAVPGEHEPRAADAAERDHRLLRDAPGGGRGPRRRGVPARPADGSTPPASICWA